MKNLRMRLSLRLLCAVAIAALSLSACASMGTEKGDQEIKGADYHYEGNTVRYTVPELTFEMSYLSPSNLDLYFSLYKEGRYKNPFPPGPYIVMSMTIENNTARKLLTYDPRRTTLYPPNGEQTFALDYTSIYTDFELLKYDDVEERMDVYRATALENTLAVEPGKKVQGLVVFSRPKDMKDGPMVVVVDRVYLDHESARVPFVFKGGFPLQR